MIETLAISGIMIILQFIEFFKLNKLISIDPPYKKVQVDSVMMDFSYHIPISEDPSMEMDKPLKDDTEKHLREEMLT